MFSTLWLTWFIAFGDQICEKWNERRNVPSLNRVVSVTVLLKNPGLTEIFCVIFFRIGVISELAAIIKLDFDQFLDVCRHECGYKMIVYIRAKTTCFDSSATFFEWRDF